MTKAVSVDPLGLLFRAGELGKADVIMFQMLDKGLHRQKLHE